MQIHNSMTTLPVLAFKEALLNTIDKNPITIVSAETGAGKSTQIPLWFFETGQKVVVTQPRRIAARALSRYLSDLTRHTWGEEIGYQTGTDQRKSRKTRLLYLTDGVQMINEIRCRQDYDLLVLDEIHEWNLNQEILIGQVKQNLSRGKCKKTVIMSATMSSQRLSRFLGNAPVVSIPGRGFPVSLHTHHPAFILSDVCQLLEAGQNVLVFQPGKSEINSFCELLRTSLKEDRIKAQILPLHSELTIQEQSKVFMHYPVPKVVVSTDVAQTSLTIDDIDAVVDTGVKKELRMINGIEGLYPTDISQAECRQRAGRAGRTRPGQYILCSEQDITDRPQYPEPEITRLSLDTVILRMMKWGLDVLRFPFYHPPRHNSVRKSLGRLITFGALNRDKMISEDGQLMADLPVSLRSARMLVEGLKGSRDVLFDTMRMIALIETRGIADTTAIPPRIHPLPLRSDLLNQLFIWKNIKIYRSLIQRKKLSQAQEIFQELKKRVAPGEIKNLTPQETQNFLMRICLSAFPDHVYERINQRYCSESEERQLDRQSCLNESAPSMVTGLPFDLQVRQQSPIGGEERIIRLNLITMVSELSWDLLSTLRPFSFRVYNEYSIVDDRIKIMRNYFFGGKKLLTRNEPPNWNDLTEAEAVSRLILDWLETHQPSDLRWRQATLEKTYNELQTQLKISLPPFQTVIRKQLSETIRDHLDHDDLHYFFQFHSSSRALTLKELLPAGITAKLRKSQWPTRHDLQWGSLQIIWLRGRPFILADMESASRLQEEDLVLCSGMRAGVILGQKRHFTWKQLVTTFNKAQKNRLFREKWADLKKPMPIEELKNTTFPLMFTGGRGLDNHPLEYYISPEINSDGTVFIRHFLTLEEAQTHHLTQKSELEKALRQVEQQSLNQLFKKKGWTVR